MTQPAIVPLHIMCVDPGHSSGWARGNTAQGPLDCGVGWDYPTFDHALVIELPGIRRGGPARHSNIIKLALNAGRHIQRFHGGAPRGVFTVPPRNWKGSIDKSIHQARVISEEARKWPQGPGMIADLQARYKSHAHDGIDAFGLLLWTLERIHLGGLGALNLWRYVP